MDEDTGQSRTTSALRDTLGCLLWWSLLIVPPIVLVIIWTYRGELGRNAIVAALLPWAAALIWRVWEGWFGRAMR